MPARSPFQRKDGTYVLPNPKTGHKVLVRARPYGMGSGRWILEAVDERGPGFGAATTVIELPLPKAKDRWASLNMPEAQPLGRGYGLCLYLAAAMFAEDMGAKGLAPAAVNYQSWRMWHSLWKHGLAVGNEPVACDRDEDYFDYDADVRMHGAAVRAFLRRTWRK